MEARIVAEPLNPLDIRDIYEGHIASSANGKPLQWLDCLSLLGLQQILQAVIGRFLLVNCPQASRSSQRSLEACVVDRLQQVVKCLHLESVHGIIVIGRQENHDRSLIRRQSPQDLYS